MEEEALHSLYGGTPPWIFGTVLALLGKLHATPPNRLLPAERLAALSQDILVASLPPKVIHRNLPALPGTLLSFFPHRDYGVRSTEIHPGDSLASRAVCK
jgi:hypothetical protein